MVAALPAPFMGKVSFISPQAEYTPPVIYSRESRSKLVFMIEAVFDPKTCYTTASRPTGGFAVRVLIHGRPGELAIDVHGMTKHFDGITDCR